MAESQEWTIFARTSFGHNYAEKTEHYDLNNNKVMAKVASNFITGSKGLLKWAVGALEWWLVQISRPTKTQDKVRSHLQMCSMGDKSFFQRND